MLALSVNSDISNIQYDNMAVLKCRRIRVYKPDIKYIVPLAMYNLASGYWLWGQ